MRVLQKVMTKEMCICGWMRCDVQTYVATGRMIELRSLVHLYTLHIERYNLRPLVYRYTLRCCPSNYECLLIVRSPFTLTYSCILFESFIHCPQTLVPQRIDKRDIES